MIENQKKYFYSEKFHKVALLEYQYNFFKQKVELIIKQRDIISFAMKMKAADFMAMAYKKLFSLMKNKDK